MNYSRKEFLTRGIFAFGRDLARVARGNAPQADSSRDYEVQGALLVNNRNCLAQRGGCFACIDRCPVEAISISPGAGIAVNQDLCDGCGECIAVCPVSPRAIVLDSSATADQNQTMKGE